MFACRHAPLVLGPDVQSTLADTYAEPQRAYHTATHIHDVLEWFDTIYDEVGWREPVDVYLAIVFHDAVYDPTRADNETRSAQLAKDLAGASDRAAELILMTASHGKLDAGAVDHDAAHFLDCDTAILGASAAVFDDYDVAIAVEYKHLSREQYRAGRMAFLQSMLARPRIFLTDFFHGRLDAQARANLARALARI